jgi:ligand-binding sensor domain-containing protein
VVWAATAEGLARYDGSGWQTVRTSLFDFAPTAVYGLAQSRRALYAATERGLWAFSGGEWVVYGREAGLPADEVYGVTITPDEQVWVGTRLGMARYDGLASGWQRLGAAEGMPTEPITQLQGQADNSVWFLVGDDAGITEIQRFDGVRATAVVLPPLLPQATRVQALGTLNGEPLVATDSGAAWRTAEGWQSLLFPGDFASNEVAGVVLSGDTVWVAGRGGISQADLSAPELVWTVDTAVGELDVPALAALTADETGQLRAAFDDPALGVLAQQPDGSWQPLRCQQEGIDAGRLYAGTLGPDGRRWFLGENGVFAYDGTRWQTFTAGLPAEPEPRHIALAPDGTAWLALQQGLYRLDTSAGAATWRLVDGDEMWRVGVSPEGEVWFAAATGLFRLTEAGRLAVGTPAITAVRAMLLTDEGLWIGHDAGLSRLSEDGWRTYTTSDGLPSNDVTALTQAPDPDGTVWAGFAVARLGFAAFNPVDETWTLRRYDPQQEDGDSSASHLGAGSLNPRRDPVTALGVTRQNDLWFGTSAGRVGGVAATGELLDGQRDPLIRWDYVNTIFEDNEEGLWIGSSNGRLVRYQQAVWQPFEAALARAQVRSLVATSQGNWLATDLGIVQLTADQCGFLTAPDRRELDVVTAVASAAGDIWWGTSNEGALRQEATDVVLNWVYPLRARDVQAVALAPDNSVWFAFGQELMRYNPASRRTETIVVTHEAVEKGMTSLGFVGGARPVVGTAVGLLMPDGAEWQLMTTAEGLADNEIQQIVAGLDGSFWLVTPGGVSHYRP